MRLGKVLMGVACFLLWATAQANSEGLGADLLVKFNDDPNRQQFRLMTALPYGSEVEDLGIGNWVRVKVPQSQMRSFSLMGLERNPAVARVQPNYPIRMMENPSLANQHEEIAKLMRTHQDLINGGETGPSDNPAIPPAGDSGSGPDPLVGQQWGILDIGAQTVWEKQKGSRDVVVAVIDTGVDYTHEDLRGNMWRNPGEAGTDSQGRDKAANGVDDDRNGYVDDVVGWDFISDDNKPYDLSVSMVDLLTGGNPGHGTHCAGNVAARGSNGIGVSGVAPNVSIMAVRFLSEKGQGTTAGAIQAIRYAIDNGAHILSNSWGSEGEDPADPDNEALREAIRYSETQGALFIAAAGNGHQGIGYDNDTDSRPAVPASYDMDIIVSVAALDANDQLGPFSNWGKTTVDIGAPGVKVFSTTVGNKYTDKVMDFLGIVITWDGTSMATPHVAGAAALYLSQNPGAGWREVKDALLKSASPIASLNGKSTSNGKLNLITLLE